MRSGVFAASTSYPTSLPANSWPQSWIAKVLVRRIPNMFDRETSYMFSQIMRSSKVNIHVSYAYGNMVFGKDMYP